MVGRTLIEHRLKQGPLLIIVDDFHWADAASIDLLRDIGDPLADRSVMMAFAHRPEFRPPVVNRIAQTTIRVAALSLGETRGLLSGLFCAAADLSCSRLRGLPAVAAVRRT